MAQGAAAAGSNTLRPRITCPAGTADAGGPRAVTGSLAGAGHNIGSLVAGGFIVGFLTSAEERGAQLAGAGRLEACAAEQIAWIERATGRSWVTQVAPKGAGREVSRTAVVWHGDDQRWETILSLELIPHGEFYTLSAMGVILSIRIWTLSFACTSLCKLLGNCSELTPSSFIFMGETLLFLQLCVNEINLSYKCYDCT